MAQTVHYKAGNGRFVKQNSPCAVAAITSARTERQKLEEQAREQDAQARFLAGRKANAARHGYRGPLTRAELAALAAAS